MKNRKSCFRLSVLLGLVAMWWPAISARADLATYFDESTLPTNLFLDVPNASVGTITLQTSMSRLLFSGPGADIWNSRNGAPYAWTPVPSIGIGGSWEAEAEVEYLDTSSYGRIVGITLYSGPDGAGGANAGQEFTFGLDHWDGPNGVWVQGLGDNRPGDSANLVSALTADKVTLRMVVSRGTPRRHTYDFYYRLTTNAAWTSVGTIHLSTAYTRAALFFKGSQMNVAFNHFLVTTLSIGSKYGCTTNADNTLTITEYAGSDSNLAIPEQIDGLPVSGIGDNAFFNCGSLASVTIPAGVTNIGSYAFYNCGSLTNVAFPEGLTAIGNYAFYNCTRLSQTSIPDSVTTLGDGTFFFCTSLTSIAFPPNLPTVGNFAFYGCSSLTNVVIPGTVNSLGSAAFCSCTALTSITLPSGLTVIGDSVFNSCTSLTDAAIPDSVTTLGSSVFGSCFSLTTMTFPNSLTTIPDSTFCNCTSLTNVVIPDGVTSIGYNAFLACTALTSFVLPTNLTSIGDGAFSQCTSLTNVVIPNTVSHMGNSVFDSCTALGTLTLPNGLTTIGDCTFSTCTSLTNVAIPNSVTAIGYCAFYACTALTRITIPSGVTWIGDYAFNYCDALTSATLPGSLTYLTPELFGCCYKLSAVYFQGNAPDADWSAFESDWNVVLYYLPSTTGWETLSANTGVAARLWNPTIQAGSQGFGPIKGGYYFNIAGTPDIPIQVEACTNLMDGSWTSLQTTTLSGGSLDFKDESYDSFPVRFYRIIGP